MLAAQSDTLPLTTVDDYADNFLAQQISQVPRRRAGLIVGERKPPFASRSIRQSSPRPA